MPSVLITGIAGFLGTHLAARYLARGFTVHGIVRPLSERDRLAGFGDGLKLHELDLSETERLRQCFAEARPDYVFHFAATTRRAEAPDYSDVLGSVSEDLINLINLLTVAAAVATPPRAFVRAGSLAEYGPGAVPFVETQRELPVASYATGLVAGTHYTSMLRARLPFAAVTARLALLYGPAQSDFFLIPQLVRNCLSGQKTVISRPNDRRDLMFVEDAVDALMQLADVAHKAPIVNIATGIAPTMAEVARLVLEATDADPCLISLGDGTDQFGGGIPDLCGSTTLLHDLTGWRAATTLAEGLDKTVHWFRRSQCKDTRELQ